MLKPFNKLRITQEAFSRLVYSEGLDYARQRFGESNFTECLIRSRAYWQWWKMLWRSIDTGLAARTESYINLQVYIATHRSRKGQFYLPETVARLSLTRKKQEAA